MPSRVGPIFTNSYLGRKGAKNTKNTRWKTKREKDTNTHQHGFRLSFAGPNHPPNRIPKGKIGKANDRVVGRKRLQLVELKEQRDLAVEFARIKRPKQ